MTVSELLARKVEQLPPERQMEVLRFVESIERQLERPEPRRDPKGLLADLRFDLTLEDFIEERREAWMNFPREFPNT